MLIFDVAVVQTIKPPDKAPYRFKLKLDTKRARWPMSALGHKPTYAVQKLMSALPLKATQIADIAGSNRGQST